ncbi:MAG TPA: DUF3810 domain-containing protein, partial [Flavisolibacter sp.]|nr:DUF3810 domain-containing protein [Flavisolibacter sp.]
LILIFVAVFIKFFSLNPYSVENYYSTSFYPIISKFYRSLFGWIPVSIGDLLYFFLGIMILFMIWKGVRLIKKTSLKEQLTWNLARNVIKGLLLIYVVFSISWGLNYYRLGIANQLNLDVQKYSTEDLVTLSEKLHERLNYFAEASKNSSLNAESNIYTEGIDSYKRASIRFPYLLIERTSIKPSLYSHVGYYFGFTGYINPFSGEAQINTTVPAFVKPFIVNHEMAHQLGYAKENEASFVAYLASLHSDNKQSRYSVYFELYRNAYFQLKKTDSVKAEQLNSTLHPKVKNDIKELQDYLKKHDNPIQSLISRVYDRYLKLNNQPKGTATYNEVVAWLVAFMKKFGVAAI